MNLPRHRAYKDSGIQWVGPVPEHWRVTPLVGVAAERQEPNSGMQEDNLLSLSYGRIVRKDIESNDGLLPASFETYQVVHQGDTVLRLTDLQNDKRSLRSAYVQERGIITSAYLALQPTGILPRFLSYLLRAYDTRKVFYSMGGGLRQSMKFSDLKRMPIAVPPEPEQEAIATFLDLEAAKIDGLAEEQRRLVGLLKEKRQAVISGAVTTGLNPNVPMKHSEVDWLGKLPAHWSVLRVKAASTFMTSGPRGWSDNISEDGALFVQSGDLTETLGIDFENAKRVVVADDAESKRTQLNSGDVLVCITGAKTGKVAVCEQVDEPAFINQHICLVRPAECLRPAYLGAYLHSSAGQRYFDLAQYGLKQGLSLENVKQAAVPVPPLTEQDQIIDYVRRLASELDALTAAAERSIALLHERRAALISAAVTGKIEVRGLVPQPEAVAV